MTARHNTLALVAALAAAAIVLLSGAPAQARDRVVVGSHHVVVPGIGIHRYYGSHTRHAFGAPINAYTYVAQPYVYASPFTVGPPPPPPYRDYGRRYYNNRYYGDRYYHDRFFNGPPRFAPDRYRDRYNPYYGRRHYHDRYRGDRYIERRMPSGERGDQYIERRIPMPRHRRR